MYIQVFRLGRKTHSLLDDPCTRLMGDTCFNNIVGKTFHLHKASFLFFYAIWASIGTL